MDQITSREAGRAFIFTRRAPGRLFPSIESARASTAEIAPASGLDLTQVQAWRCAVGRVEA